MYTWQKILNIELQQILLSPLNLLVLKMFPPKVIPFSNALFITYVRTILKPKFIRFCQHKGIIILSFKMLLFGLHPKVILLPARLFYSLYFISYYFYAIYNLPYKSYPPFYSIQPWNFLSIKNDDPFFIKKAL